jgi:hypothetical protein
MDTVQNCDLLMYYSHKPTDQQYLYEEWSNLIVYNAKILSSLYFSKLHDRVFTNLV